MQEPTINGILFDAIKTPLTVEQFTRVVQHINELSKAQDDPLGYWLRQRRAAILRRAPLWLVTLYLKAQLFLHAVANPRK